MIYYRWSSLVVLLFTFLTSSAMDPHMDPPVKRQYPLNLLPMRFADDPVDENIINPHPITITDPTAPTFEGIPVQDLDTALKFAPQGFHSLLSYLTKGHKLHRWFYQTKIIFGDHGVGKTVLVKALVHKACTTAGWAYEYISSRAFMGQHRNETGVCLRSYIDEVEKLTQPTILIIDQLNKILDYPDDSHDDTSFASDLICHLLDDNQKNPNLFFIGIMDRACELDQRLKSRIKFSLIKINEPTDPDFKRIIFTSKCITNSIRFHPEVTPQWLAQFLTNAPMITGRNFRCLAVDLHKAVKQNTFNRTWIGKKDLHKVLTQYLKDQKDIYHIDPYESRMDRDERLHQEALRRRQEEYDLQHLLLILLYQHQNTQNQRSSDAS